MTTGFDPEDERGRPRSAPQGKSSDRAMLAEIAREAMLEHGLEPNFPPAAQLELAAIRRPAEAAEGARE